MYMQPGKEYGLCWWLAASSRCPKIAPISSGWPATMARLFQATRSKLMPPATPQLVIKATAQVNDFKQVMVTIEPATGAPCPAMEHCLGGKSVNLSTPHPGSKGGNMLAFAAFATLGDSRAAIPGIIHTNVSLP
jgi:hypothetical protein